jgi:hypothetical protein
VDHHDPVGHRLQLAELVAGDQDAAPFAGQLAQEAAHPADAERVQPVGRLVQHQDRRVGQQGRGQRQPLPHAQGVAARTSPRVAGQLHQVQHRIHPAIPDPGDRGQAAQEGAAGLPRVRARGVEHGPDLVPWPLQLGVPASRHERRSLGRRDQAQCDAHRRRLAGAVHPHETGHRSHRRRERNVVQHPAPAEVLGQSSALDPVVHLPPPPASMGRRSQ